MTSKNLKSMKESMLEYVVMNYIEVFSSILQGSFKQGTALRKKLLPPYLFEKIIDKSKEMIWCINGDYLQKLLPCRDILRWKNINVNLHYNVCTNHILNAEVLNLMSRVEYPLKKLSIHVERISEESMNALCSMGSTIECLDLMYEFRDVNEILNGPFPNLRKLRLTCFNQHDALYIDLSRFSDTLEELKLERETLDDRLTGSISCLKNLKVLSLPFASFSFDYLNESLSSMTYLRTLDIRYVNHIYKGRYTPFADLSKLLPTISKMPDLDNLDLPLSYQVREDILESLKCRKLKKFGNFNIDTKEFQPFYSKFKILADQVFGLYEETLLPTFEIYAQDNPTIIWKILIFIPNVSQDQLERFENVILKSLLGSFYPLGEIARDYILTSRCTDDFVTKLVNIMSSLHYGDFTSLEILASCMHCDHFKELITSAPMVRKMLEILEKGLNKGLSKKLLKMFFVCSYYNLNKDIRELGLQDVCDRAITNNVIDDNVMMAMKTLLKKINYNLKIKELYDDISLDVHQLK